MSAKERPPLRLRVRRNCRYRRRAADKATCGGWLKLPPKETLPLGLGGDRVGLVSGHSHRVFARLRHRPTPRAAYLISRLINDIQLNDDWKRINPDGKTFGIVATSRDELKSSTPTVRFFSSK